MQTSNQTHKDAHTPDRFAAELAFASARHNAVKTTRRQQAQYQFARDLNRETKPIERDASSQVNTSRSYQQEHSVPLSHPQQRLRENRRVVAVVAERQQTRQRCWMCCCPLCWAGCCCSGPDACPFWCRCSYLHAKKSIKTTKRQTTPYQFA